jgi:adenine C2-methylase RlmN of 23S rRNA A2503 and tRNA A37
MSFTLEDVCHHSQVEYAARVFNKQEGYRFTYKVDDTMYIETGAYLHYDDDKAVDIALDLSCMSGCVHKCLFCASARHGNCKALTASQIVEQVDTTLKHIECAQSEFLARCPKLTISFEGMGEPTDSSVASSIVDAIAAIGVKYRTTSKRRTQFLVSTVGSNPDVIREWADRKLPLETLQLSLHAVTDDKRRAIIGARVPVIEDVFEALGYFKRNCPDTLIKVNYLMMKIKDEINYSNAELDKLLELLDGTDYLLKIAHLNNTTCSRRNRIRGEWQPDVNVCYDYLLSKHNHGRVYEYGTASDLLISCGQLASYAERQDALDEKAQTQIREIYEELTERNVVLFLGAGVSRSLWDADSLAEELFRELKTGQTYDDKLGLQGVVDICYSRGRQELVNNKLKNTIENSEVPPEFSEITMHPWTTVYTTNYDDFIERAYKQSQERGQTTYSCKRISKLSDYELKVAPQSIPVIKLHGCINDSIDTQVISSLDYMQLYWDGSRQSLLRRFSTDVLQHCVVFSGYSMNDTHIARILFDAKRAKGMRLKGYVVSPKRDNKLDPDLEHVLLEKFDLKTVHCSFAEFLAELSRLRRKPRVFVSGSVKRDVPGRSKRYLCAHRCYQHGQVRLSRC